MTIWDELTKKGRQAGNYIRNNRNEFSYIADTIGSRLAPSNPLAGVGSMLAQRNQYQAALERQRAETADLYGFAQRTMQGDIPLTPVGSQGMSSVTMKPNAQGGSEITMSFSHNGQKGTPAKGKKSGEYKGIWDATVNPDTGAFEATYFDKDLQENIPIPRNYWNAEIRQAAAMVEGQGNEQAPVSTSRYDPKQDWILSDQQQANLQRMRTTAQRDAYSQFKDGRDFGFKQEQFSYRKDRDSRAPAPTVGQTLVTPDGKTIFFDKQGRKMTGPIDAIDTATYRKRIMSHADVNRANKRLSDLSKIIESGVTYKGSNKLKGIFKGDMAAYNFHSNQLGRVEFYTALDAKEKGIFSDSIVSKPYRVRIRIVPKGQSGGFTQEQWQKTIERLGLEEAIKRAAFMGYADKEQLSGELRDG